jgi:hypothetical protein
VSAAARTARGMAITVVTNARPSQYDLLNAILDLSPADARIALLSLAGSPYRKYREAAAKALRMLEFNREYLADTEETEGSN